MTKTINIIALFLLALCGAASAQSLSAGQRATLCAACKADTACNAPRLIGDAAAVYGWLNTARTPATLAWHAAAPQSSIRQAPAYAAYDSLLAGKRDSWVLLLADPQDFTRAKTRNWVTDIWGAATAGSNAEAVLQAATFAASNAQHALGGTLRTTGTVSALDLVWPRGFTLDDANHVANPAVCS